MSICKIFWWRIFAYCPNVYQLQTWELILWIFLNISAHWIVLHMILKFWDCPGSGCKCAHASSCVSFIYFIFRSYRTLSYIIPHHTSFVKYQHVVISAFIYFLHELNTSAEIKQADESRCWACFWECFNDGLIKYLPLWIVCQN